MHRSFRWTVKEVLVAVGNAFCTRTYVGGGGFDRWVMNDAIDGVLLFATNIVDFETRMCLQCRLV